MPSRARPRSLRRLLSAAASSVSAWPVVVLTLFAAAPPAQVRLETQARGHFGAETGGELPVQTNHIEVGDVDGDGDPDLVLATLGTPECGYIAVSLNDGNGAFGPCRSFFVPGPYYRSALLRDFDGDTDLDLLAVPGYTVIYGSNQPAQLYFNDGTGSFAGGSGRIPGQAMSAPYAQAADWDRDGDVDIAIVQENSYVYTVVLWDNDGTGTFTDVTAARLPAVSLTGLSGSSQFVRFHELDVDSDGDRDLLVSSRGNLLLVNDGSGNFVDRSSWLASGRLHAVGDLDGDGDVDLVGSNSVHINDGTGTGWKVLSTGVNVGSLRSMSVADLDLDGRPDIVGVDWAARPSAYLQEPDGTFRDVTSTWFAPHTQTNYSTASSQFCAHATQAVVDIDLDGDPDLLTGGVVSRARVSFTVGIPPRVLVNTGGERFVDGAKRALPHHQQNTFAAAAGDVDGDGDVDLLFAHQGAFSEPAHEALWINDGNGTFDLSAGRLPGWPVGGKDTATAAAFVDVDGDGDLDLVEGRGFEWPAGMPFFGPAQNRLGLNDGTGVFADETAARLPVRADTTTALACGDVDGDGDTDLVFGNAGDPFQGQGEQNRLYLNDGKGGFSDATATQLPQVQDLTFALALADVDGDGDLDVVVANQPYGGPGLALWLNDGSGSFADATAGRIPPQPALGAVAVGDVDGDGDLDIAIAGKTLVNDGTGTFSEEAYPGPGSRPVRILLGDLDGDGVADRVEGVTDYCHVNGQRYLWGWAGAALRGIALADLDQDDDLDLVVSTTGPASGGEWSRLPIGAWFNMQRQLRAPTTLRVGQPYRLEYRAVNGTSGATWALTLLGVGTLQPRVELSGLGRFGVDLTLSAVLPLVTVPDADTKATLALSVPNDPGAVGLELAAQCLFVPVGAPGRSHLSNVVVQTILR